MIPLAKGNRHGQVSRRFDAGFRQWRRTAHAEVRARLRGVVNDGLGQRQCFVEVVVIVRRVEVSTVHVDGERLRVLKGNLGGVVQDEAVREWMRLRGRGFDVDRAENGGVQLMQFIGLDVQIRRQAMPDEQALRGSGRVGIDRILETRVKACTGVATADIRRGEADGEKADCDDD